MNTREFFTGRAIGFIVLLIILGLFWGFGAFNNYIYKEKQADPAIIETNLGTPVFSWRYEKANSLNLDGMPNTDVFLDLKYQDGSVVSKLVDTTPGGCNELTSTETDSVVNSKNVQCYSAGLGYTFKITDAGNAYTVQRKTFEEAIPNYNPPAYKWEIIYTIEK